MPAGKRTPSAHKPAKPPSPPEPPRYFAYIGQDARGRLCFLGDQADGAVQAGSGLTEIAVVDIGRPFELRVPSTPSHEKTGLVITGMTGTNAEPWLPSMILAAAREGCFGFRLVDPAAAAGETP